MLLEMVDERKDSVAQADLCDRRCRHRDSREQVKASTDFQRFPLNGFAVFANLIAPA